MSNDELRAWMTARGLTSARLAAELGVSSRTIKNWRAGVYPVPRMAVLALTTLE